MSEIWLEASHFERNSVFFVVNTLTRYPDYLQSFTVNWKEDCAFVDWRWARKLLSKGSAEMLMGCPVDLVAIRGAVIARSTSSTKLGLGLYYT